VARGRSHRRRTDHGARGRAGSERPGGLTGAAEPLSCGDLVTSCRRLKNLLASAPRERRLEARRASTRARCSSLLRLLPDGALMAAAITAHAPPPSAQKYAATTLAPSTLALPTCSKNQPDAATRRRARTQAASLIDEADPRARTRGFLARPRVAITSHSSIHGASTPAWRRPLTRLRRLSVTLPPALVPPQVVDVRAYCPANCTSSAR